MNDLKYIFPDESGFKGDFLDNYHSIGYFRTLHILFSGYYIKNEFEEFPSEIFWVRLNIKNINESKQALSIRKKCNEFTITYKKEIIDSEIEELYKLYKESVKFTIAPTCKDYLHVSYLENPFDSWIVEVRDNDKLIAVSFFDLGKISINAYLNIYHPDYKKYCLGHFLTLAKINYCFINNITYLYRGYVSSSTTKFDYKIFPDINSCEVFLPIKNIWVSYDDFPKDKLVEFYIENDIKNL